jgi:hypothetical protein
LFDEEFERYEGQDNYEEQKGRNDQEVDILSSNNNEGEEYPNDDSFKFSEH